MILCNRFPHITLGGFAFIIFSMFVRATFKVIKQRDEIFWLCTLDIANSDTCDLDNRKIKYSYADLSEKEKLLLQNF